MVYDIIIVGGGIVGLSTAYQIINQYPDKSILLLEKESAVARHQTGHNSGVIHSGVYYKPGSNKAKNCLKGYQLLLNFAEEHSIPHQFIGKLIVATKETERKKLDAIYQNGLQLGLAIRKISGEAVKEMEPNVTCLEAIDVPQAGIIHYPDVAEVLYRQCIQKNCTIELDKNVSDIQVRSKMIVVTTLDHAEYSCKFLINCAGLQSDRITKLAGVENPYRIIPFKGIYYQLVPEKKDIVHKLIYPVPDPNFPFLGIHYTRLMSGAQTLGPNAVLSLDREAYHRHSLNAKDSLDIFNYPGFYKLIAKHWNVGLGEYIRNYSKSYFAKKASEMTPGIEAKDLLPGGAGIRAQVIDKQGNMVDDFVVLKKENMIHVCNAPSPAATAGLAIGLQICEWYRDMQN